MITRMEIFLLILAVVTLCVLLLSTIQMAIGNHTTKYLRNIPDIETENCPGVSIIAPARNEQKNILHALKSLLDLDYPNLEIIVINDRSTDNTGTLLEELAQIDQRLKIIHIKQLPPGWLGKNHALWTGAKNATGKHLLFTDADVVMKPDTLKKAINFATQNNLDHLAISPMAPVKGILLQMLIGTFFYLFILGTQAWKARNPKSRKFIGIGAFNLVKADTYKAIGTHKTLAMRPDDDMALGRIIKRKGYRQDILHGRDMIEVEWYSSIRQMVVGLEKNVFSGFNYSITLTLTACLLLLTVFAFPLAAMFLTTGITRILNILIVLLLIASYADNEKPLGLKKSHAVALPVMACVLTYIIIRATAKTLINNGVDWRGTHYSLKDLKANNV